MSKEINNREFRQNTLLEMIRDLHAGKGVDEVKGRFAEVFEGVSAEEIAQAEAALIANGLPVEEVQRLCDVHAAVFKGSIEEIHAAVDPSEIPGHPLNTLMRENRAIEAVLDEVRARLDAGEDIADALGRLSQIDLHYKLKENLFFPYMEQYGITAPPKVMWGVDDEIRAELKAVKAAPETPRAKIDALLKKIGEMVFKEEHIMLPMLAENLTRDEWKKIADETSEIGYCLIDPPPVWMPAASEAEAAAPRTEAMNGTITLPTGTLGVEELARMLDALPFDITFVGKDDTVKYFSQNAERIFPRTKAVIGRKVSNCHPPASVHIVEKLVEDLRAGRKESEDFWINMRDKLILIRYLAVRGAAGEFLGVLEVTQNIRPIQELKGEKRLVTD